MKCGVQGEHLDSGAVTVLISSALLDILCSRAATQYEQTRNDQKESDVICSQETKELCVTKCTKSFVDGGKLVPCWKTTQTSFDKYCIPRHTKHFTNHTSVVLCSSHVIHHTSHVTRYNQTTNITLHTSHLTPHTSHLTPHTAISRACNVFTAFTK